LDGRGSIPIRCKGFSLIHSVQTGFKAYSGSHPMATGRSFLRNKKARAWSWPLICV
jgi:hypothetical protein